MVKRGNIQKELSQIGEESGEGTEIQAITLFKLMKSFERVMIKLHDRVNKPTHTVVQYDYTMEASRDAMLSLAQREKTISFEKIFDDCADRVHAIFLFLSLLELVQQKFLKIIIGQGRNNFIIEYNEPENRLAEWSDEANEKKIDYNNLNYQCMKAQQLQTGKVPVKKGKEQLPLKAGFFRAHPFRITQGLKK
jgi:segregation and condensation protein A